MAARVARTPRFLVLLALCLLIVVFHQLFMRVRYSDYSLESFSQVQFGYERSLLLGNARFSVLNDSVLEQASTTTTSEVDLQEEPEASSGCMQALLPLLGNHVPLETIRLLDQNVLEEEDEEMCSEDTLQDTDTSVQLANQLLDKYEIDLKRSLDLNENTNGE